MCERVREQRACAETEKQTCRQEWRWERKRRMSESRLDRRIKPDKAAAGNRERGAWREK